MTINLADLFVESRNRVVVAHLEGEVDLSNAGALRASILEQIPNDALGVAIDLTKVSYLDSAGIQAVYELNERLRNRAQVLRLIVPPDSLIARTLHIVNAGSIIGIAESTDEALSELESGIAGG